MNLLGVINLHRQQLRGLIEIRGVERMRKIYDRARRELRDKLAALEREGRGQTFTAHHLRIVLAQVGDAIRGLQSEMLGHLEDTGKIATAVAPRHLVDAVTAGEKMFRGVTPVVQAAEAAVFLHGYRGLPPALLNKYEVSVRTYGPAVIDRIRDELAMSIAAGRTVDEMVDKVAGTSGIFQMERYRADRIVRTETSYAYGVSKQRSMEDMRPSVPMLMKRLVMTDDSRTGDDSRELNGQTVPVDQPFVWIVKNSKGVPTGKVVRYMQPPNRPNDREVVIPWLQGWPEQGLANPGPAPPTTKGVPASPPTSKAFWH